MFTSSNQKPVPRFEPEKYHAQADGIKRGMPEFVLSRSSLTDFAKSPYKWFYGTEKESTKAMLYGNVFDTLLLMPESFESKYIIQPETYPVKPTKADERTEKPWHSAAQYCKDWAEEQSAKGLTVVPASLCSDANNAVVYLKNDRLVKSILDSSDAQVFFQVEWHDKETNMVVPFRVLADLVPRPDSKWGKCLFDVKTTDDASIDGWARTVRNYRYYYQAAIYLDAINAATGLDYSRFGNIVQESSAPFEIARRMISDTYIEIGRAEYRKDLANYCRCLKANDWPSYDDWDEDNTDSPVIGGFRYVDAPNWLVKNSAIMQ